MIALVTFELFNLFMVFYFSRNAAIPHRLVGWPMSLEISAFKLILRGLYILLVNILSFRAPYTGPQQQVGRIPQKYLTFQSKRHFNNRITCIRCQKVDAAP